MDAKKWTRMVVSVDNRAHTSVEAIHHNKFLVPHEISH